MKICFVHEEYPKETNFGGIATYQKIMAEYYANHGHQVTVISRGGEDIDYYEHDVHIYRVKSENDNNNLVSVKEYRKKVSIILKKLQNNKEIEIIETPDWGANTIYFEKDRKIPLVVRLHTPLKIWLKYNNNYFGETKDLILKWEDKMIKQADTITSCSNLLKEMVEKEYAINRNIVVTPNPYNNIDFFPSKNNQNHNMIYIGSLEERKGVLLLAKALNVVLDRIDIDKIYFVGKDTTRNNKNVSTKQYILKLLNKKFHHKIVFVGQIDNEEINKYLNDSSVAIFPSIFDNYPYVILESMASGNNIVCSDNIGLIDILGKNNYIFKSGDYLDLADKIKICYDNSKQINTENINKVNFTCNQDKVCNNMLTIYENTIKKYTQNEKLMNYLLKSVNIKEKIKKVVKNNYNLANEIYYVLTNKKKYVIKKYNYIYDFHLANQLCDIYKDEQFNVVKPINNNIITYNNLKYNIYNYIKHRNQKISDDFYTSIIKCKRDTLEDSNLINKCDNYYNYLINEKHTIFDKEIHFTLNTYKEISNLPLFQEKYLNHGDLSKSNILCNDDKCYIIDFDETVITTELYDFAVIVIKNKLVNNSINKTDLIEFINKIGYTRYSIPDYINVIKIYLCKILLEKFYLHYKKEIDLFSINQRKDNYIKYYNLLTKICKWGEEDWKTQY